MRSLYVTILALIIVTVGCVALSDISDDTEAASGTGIKVYIENADGMIPSDPIMVDSAGSVRQAVDKALEKAGYIMVLDDLGRISSIGGRTAPSGEIWVVQQWMPLGTHDWYTVAFDEESDSRLKSGTTYCIHTAGFSSLEGSIVYDTPGFEPTSEAYFFIRFVYNYDDDVEEIQDAYTKEIRREGFWIKGTGSNLSKALHNAVETYGFQIESFNGVSGGNDLQGWISTFFTLKDEKLGGANDWAYWSQFVYENNKWGYNDYTLGYYDPGVYKYAGIVRIIAIDGVVDEGGRLPEPTDIKVMKPYEKVTVNCNGTYLDTIDVRYGHNIELNKLPGITVPNGMEFLGWGDISDAVTDDMQLDVSVVPISDEGYRVRYYAYDERTLLHTEYVPIGGKASYAGSAYRPSTVSTDHVFSGWDKQLTSVQDNIDTYPVFDPIPRKYSVTFKSYDGTDLKKVEVDYGKGIPQSEYPDAPSRESTVQYEYTFICWSLSTVGGSAVDLGSITSNMVVFSYLEESKRKYTVDVHMDGNIIYSCQRPYGTQLGDLIFLDPLENGYVRLFSDIQHRSQVSASDKVFGAMDLYAVPIPGNYDTNRTQSGAQSGNDITIRYTKEVAAELKDSGSSTIADISFLTPGRRAVIDSASIMNLKDAFGDDAYLRIMMSDSFLEIRSKDLADLVGNGSSLTIKVSQDFSDRAKKSSAKVLGLNEAGRREFSVSSGSGTVQVTCDTRLGFITEANAAYAWDNGAFGRMKVNVTGGALSFSAVGLPSVILCNSDTPGDSPEGPSGPVSPPVTDNGHICPYGDVRYLTFGTGTEGDPYRSTLISMELRTSKNVLFVPSAMEGYPLTVISAGAFENVIGPTIAVIPKTIDTIDLSAFNGSTLTTVYFMGDKPTMTGACELEMYIIKGSSGWEGSNTSGIMDIKEYKGGNFTYIIINDEAIVISAVSNVSDVRIPAIINDGRTNYSVTAIGDMAFYGSEFRDIYIPYTVTDVLTRAFYKSTVAEIHIVDDLGQQVSADRWELINIWDEAFRACTALISFDIPSDTEFIGFEAFRDCFKVEHLVIPDSVKELGGGAFYDCTGLQDVIIGKGVSTLPERCFAYCTMLNGVRLPDNIHIIENGAFSKCYHLSSIRTNNVASIGNNAFNLCNSLNDVILDAPLKELGYGVFDQCAMLKVIRAYCAQPEGFVDAVPSDITVKTSKDVSSEWSVEHEAIVDLSVDEKKGIPVGIVAGSLVGVFLVIGYVAYFFRTRKL